MFISQMFSRFKNLNISVEIDPNLLESLDCEDKTTTERTIKINLYKLIYAMGTIQSRRFAPSNRQKYLDKMDLIEKIYSDSEDLKIKINETRLSCGSEILTTMSEDFGVGISVVISMSLYNVQESTIQRIYGNDKRPDWKCQTEDNRILIVESKGSTSMATSRTQETNALYQKTRRNGDIKVASLTVLNENQISTNRFLDPPIEPNNMDSQMKNKILRAGHYSSVFSFLGHSVLSNYFSQMRKRLANSITIQEQSQKDNIYNKIRDKYSNINFNNKLYVGTFYQIEDSKYLFIGVDRDLISYEGFIDFVEYEKDIEKVIEENNHILFKDGILIVEINNISFFSKNINISKIKNYQEFNTISDVDSMTELSFEKYILYILKDNGFSTITESKINNFRANIIGTINNEKYLFELKLSKKKKFSTESIKQLESIMDLKDIKKMILITNAKIPTDLKFNNRINIIGRDELKMIFKNNKLLMELIN